MLREGGLKQPHSYTACCIGNPPKGLKSVLSPGQIQKNIPKPYETLSCAPFQASTPSTINHQLKAAGFTSPPTTPQCTYTSPKMTRPTTKASTTLPLLYRFILTTYEPLSTIYGIFLALFDPETLTFIYFSGGRFHYTPDTQVLHTQIAGLWAFLGLLEVFMLRSFDDLKLWKRFCACLLVSDAAYYHAMAQAAGGWGVWLDFRTWPAWDFVVNGLLVGVTLTRVLVVLGVGVGSGSGSGSEGEGKGKGE